MITIFAPEHSDQRPVRIWNRQLINYAGHRRSDGSILGDPLNVPLTEVVRKLGWTRDPAGPFDLLPLLIETSEGLRWFDWPEGLILEVPIRHPDHPWFEELQLKWYALPAVSGMLLQIGGVKFRPPRLAVVCLHRSRSSRSGRHSALQCFAYRRQAFGFRHQIRSVALERSRFSRIERCRSPFVCSSGSGHGRSPHSGAAIHAS